MTDLEKRIEQYRAQRNATGFVKGSAIETSLLLLDDCQAEIASLQRQLEAAEKKIATAREMLEDLTGGFTSEADMQAARLVIDELIGKVEAQ